MVIDLQTGERLYLDDIIELTDSFTKLILAQNDKYAYLEEFFWPVNEADVLRIFSEATISEFEYQQEIAKNDFFYDMPTKVAHILATKSSVGLTTDGLLLTRRKDGFEQDMIFPYDDLIDLKVTLDSDVACSGTLNMHTSGKQNICQSNNSIIP